MLFLTFMILKYFMLKYLIEALSPGEGAEELFLKRLHERGVCFQDSGLKRCYFPECIQITKVS